MFHKYFSKTISQKIPDRDIDFSLGVGQKSAGSGTRVQWVGKEYREWGTRVLRVGHLSAKSGVKE